MQHIVAPPQALHLPTVAVVCILGPYGKSHAATESLLDDYLMLRGCQYTLKGIDRKHCVATHDMQRS